LTKPQEKQSAANYIHWELPNGIRVIHSYIPNQVSHCGLFINTGSRDELENEHGLAHFIEHTIFKGTKKRKAFHILTCMEDVGGEINAYTSKEETCVYSTFLYPHYKRALELLVDITFHSVFPEKEIAKEKTVIIDEINSYKDSPSEEIFDRFEEFVYPNHSLGHDILGTPAQLKKFDAGQIRKFIARTYNTDQIVFSSVGNISEKNLRRIVDSTLGLIPANHRDFKREPIPDYIPFHKSLKRRTYQAHLIMGNRAYTIKDNRRSGMILLNNLLGGPGMSSRLNLAIREKYGFTYNIDSSYSIYSDTGLWTVYLGTDQELLERCRDLTTKELLKLKTSPLGSVQLHKAKQQLIGQIAIAQESNVSLMLGYAKTFLVFNKIDSFEQIVKKIEAITSNDLIEIANEIFGDDQLSVLSFPSK
jgi:predicted Zn-dependent peptidase